MQAFTGSAEDQQDANQIDDSANKRDGTNQGSNDASGVLYSSVGTFGGRATPLILMDDIEISSFDLNNIPVESIESFSILKDASATAIYGARGANGVMLITTKNGAENQKTQIHVTFENFFTPRRKMNFVDGALALWKCTTKPI